MSEQLDRIEMSLAELKGKVDALQETSEKMRKYFLYTLVATVLVVVLPLLVLPLLLPAALSSLVVPAGF